MADKGNSTLSKRPFLVNDQTNVVHMEPLRESHEKRIRNLEEIIAVQLHDGNWNLDPYMLGLTNGLLLAQSIMDDLEPNFLDAPDAWKADEIANYGPPQPESTS